MRLALVIGVQRVDPRCYYGHWEGRLRGPEGDAAALAAIAAAAGFDGVEVRTTEQATCGAVLRSISNAAATLRAGDLYLLGFSGHGRQFKTQDPEVDSGDDEPDGLDETWCLFDGQILDDDVRHALSKFVEGVRVVVVSDSCHSGTVVWRILPTGRGWSPLGRNRRVKALPAPIGRMLDKVQRGSDGVRRLLLAEARQPVRARVLLLSACADGQEALDGAPTSVFTRALVDAWESGAGAGTYAQLRDRIAERVPKSQLPQLTPFGTGASFVDEVVFTIGA